MKPPPFEYQAPESLAAAVASMQQHGDEAKLLAGGQSLVPAMNFRLVQPAVLVDLNRVQELDFVHQDGNGDWSIGAMTRQRTLEKHARLAQDVPLLQTAAGFIAHPQIRNRGTLGGSLVHADPAAELPVVAVASGARLRAVSAGGERWIPAEDFFLGMFTTALAPDEILAEVVFPAQPPDMGWAFVEFARRHGDYALVGLAALVGLDQAGVCRLARLVYLNVGDGPLEARSAAEVLIGETPGPEIFRDAAEVAATQEVDPYGNVHATPAYQRHLARALTVRALTQAFDRARSLGQQEELE